MRPSKQWTSLCLALTSLVLLKSSHPWFGCGQVLVSLQIYGLKILLIWIQNSFAVAKKLLKDLRKEAKTREDWLVRWNHAYCRFAHSSSCNLSCPERLLSVFKTISLLGNSLCFTLFVWKGALLSRYQLLFLSSSRRYQIWLSQHEHNGLPKPESSSGYYISHHGQCA